MEFIVRDPDKGYLDCWLWAPKKFINVNGTKRALTFQTKEGREQVDLPLWKETAHHLLLPRAFWDPKNLPFEVIDCRPPTFTRVDITSRIVLDFKSPGETIQTEAVDALLAAQGGILQLSCGKGKTIIFLDAIAKMHVPALILVDTTQLMKQWLHSINTFLDVPGGVGIIKGARFEWNKALVISTYQTMANRAMELPEEVRRHFGVIGWDEGHHVNAPTFCLSADLFYGRRIALTATPEREDGAHVIADFHIGPVLYKNLTQELRPKIFFKWTGFDVDLSDPKVEAEVCDVNHELHTSKLYTYFGKYRPRLEYIINEVSSHVQQGRKVLVLSYSIDELINLLALWNTQTAIFTDIPEPTLQEVNCTVPPVPAYDAEVVEKIQKDILSLKAMLTNPSLNIIKRSNFEKEIQRLTFTLEAYATRKKMDAEIRRRQKIYLDALLQQPSTAGLLIGRIHADERHRMLKEKAVVFSIIKYGREGLDNEDLDTVIACEPMSSKGTLQQLMGRVLRTKHGKKQPLVIFLEDDVGPLIGMCKKLRTHLMEWPHEESGPYDYELVGHPHKKKGLPSTWNTF